MWLKELWLGAAEGLLGGTLFVLAMWAAAALAVGVLVGLILLLS